jgi:hypothetical protein
MNKNEQNIKNKIKKCNHLIDDIIGNNDEKRVVSKVKKLIYELE